MDKSASDDVAPNRPGAVSVFFVYKAGLFAAVFWGWLAVLLVRDTTLSPWHVTAAAGAVTTTLVGVILGVRLAMERAAVDRHATLMRTLVDISWYTFAPPTSPSVGGPTTLAEGGGDADVIRLPQESRPRPRR